MSYYEGSWGTSRASTERRSTRPSAAARLHVVSSRASTSAPSARTPIAHAPDTSCPCCHNSRRSPINCRWRRKSTLAHLLRHGFDALCACKMKLLSGISFSAVELRRPLVAPPRGRGEFIGLVPGNCAEASPKPRKRGRWNRACTLARMCPCAGEYPGTQSVSQASRIPIIQQPN